MLPLPYVSSLPSPPPTAPPSATLPPPYVLPLPSGAPPLLAVPLSATRRPKPVASALSTHWRPLSLACPALVPARVATSPRHTAPPINRVVGPGPRDNMLRQLATASRPPLARQPHWPPSSAALAAAEVILKKILQIWVNLDAIWIGLTEIDLIWIKFDYIRLKLSKYDSSWLCYTKFQWNLVMLCWVWVKFDYVTLNWTKFWLNLIMLDSMWM
jgi:hypothetical protein